MRFNLQTFYENIDKRLFSSIAANFFNSAFSVTAITYINLLFLSTYPKTYLPFLYAAEAFFASIALILKYILTKKLRYFIAYFQIFAALSISVFIFFLRIPSTFLPFAFCLLLSILNLVMASISWSSISTSFNIREFKKVGRWISIGGTIGAAICGLLIPILIKEINTEILLYLMVFLTLITVPLMLNLKPVISQPLPLKRVHFGYTLFYKVALFSSLVIAVYTLADYSLKIQLMTRYDKDQIGEFMGLFIAITNIFALVTDIVGTKLLIQQFGIIILSLILPLFTAVSSIGAFIMPSLTSSIILLGGMNVFTKYNILSRELMLNILPWQIRNAGQFQLNILIKPLGTLTGALIILALSKYLTLRMIAVLILLFCIILVFLIKPLKKSYSSTLEEAVKFKRYLSTSGDFDPANSEILQETALSSLHSDDPDVIRFGLSLLSQLDIKQTPEAIKTLLNSPHEDIKIESIKIITQLHDEAMIPLLVEQLKKEKNDLVIWWIMNAISSINPSIGHDLALTFLKSSSPEKKAAAIQNLFKIGHLNELLDALGILKNMIASDDAKMRKFAARVMEHIKVGNLSSELGELIVDKNEEVSIAAIQAAESNQIEEVIPAIVKQLDERSVSFYAANALKHFQMKSVPALISVISQEKSISHILSAIRTLAMMPLQSVEFFLSELAEFTNVLITTTLSKYIAYRAIKYPLSDNFKSRIRFLILNEAKRINILKYLQTQSLPKYMIDEIKSRQFLAEIRYLHWIASYTDPKPVMQIIPSMYFSDLARSEAIEFLDTIIHDRKIAKTLNTVFEAAPVKLLKNDFSSFEKILNDPWLTKINQLKESKKEDAMLPIQKVLFLRSVELFHDLPAETLLAIAEEIQDKEIYKDEVIFSQGDPPTGLYIVYSGTVELSKDSKKLTLLKQHEFFGELGLIDNSPRAATATAKTDGMLLYIDKLTFDRITDDLPEVLKTVTKVIMRYLRSYIATQQRII